MDPAFSYKGLKTEFSQAKDKIEWTANPTVAANDQFAVEIDHMSQCIMKDQKPYTPGEEGLQDHKIMQAIYQSASEQKVVKLERLTGTDLFRGTKPAEEE
jgi:predicted dehydrogenase